MMISAQKEVEIAKTSYNDLKRVRSIWICMGAADDEDSIDRIILKRENVFGNPAEFRNLDKVVGVMIRIRENENVEESRNTLIRMLEELLSRKPAKEKKENLENDYGIIMSEDMERRINIMCNLSDILIEKGIAEGMEKGRKEGMKEGQTVLINAISMLRAGKTVDELLKQGFDQNTIDLAYAVK